MFFLGILEWFNNLSVLYATLLRLIPNLVSTQSTQKEYTQEWFVTNLRAGVLEV